MMYLFASIKVSAKMFFHDKSMFPDIPFRIVWMFWAINKDIPHT